jgi:hypothetical protein
MPSLEFSIATKRNVGSNSKLNKLPKQYKYGIIVPDEFELVAADLLTAAALKAALQDAILAAVDQRAYLLPPIFKCEDISQDATYDDSSLGIDDVYDGQYRYRLHVSKNMFTHKDLNSHYYKNEGRIILFDLENKMELTEKSNGNFTGQSIALLKPEKMKRSDGSVSTTSPMYLCLSDNKEWDEKGRLFDGSIIRELQPLVDVKIGLVEGDAFAAAGFEVDVNVESDGTPVSGLLLADFILYAADGVTEQVIQTAAEDANTPGRYNIVAPGANLFEDGVLTLRAAADLTVSAYENPTRLRLAVNV